MFSGVHFGNQATGSVGGAIYAVDEFKVINSTFFKMNTDGRLSILFFVGIPRELSITYVLR